MTENPFKFDVRVRDRLRRRGAVSAEEVEKYLKALPDVGSQAHLLEVVDPNAGDPVPRGTNGSAGGGDDA